MRQNETIKESPNELFKLLARTKRINKKKVTMLIEIKEAGRYLTKKELAVTLKVDPNTIVKWRNLYLKQGIKELLKEKRGGKRRIIISDNAHGKILNEIERLTQPFKSFKKFHEWVESKMHSSIKYNTLYSFCKRNNIKIPLK
jgi:hypothetical protein